MYNYFYYFIKHMKAQISINIITYFPRSNAAEAVYYSLRLQ